ncbi:HAL/PAL/TAL family ammonia-lyase [Zophobihabitans entericus]|uniref:Aromatic amino acid lyase n=1 Tax=Zophobihabitans entericus TaxID=1635327 RepID=A0A6G9ICQ8_9GAMM|nr:aromatic amino acid ammonia-lyase [Zophobihabitans entericus]QIQ22018.1 aromatic amino acid lyase [Zophobihabitans entericus]
MHKLYQSTLATSCKAVFASVLLSVTTFASATITLDGNSVKYTDIVKIADGEEVKIAPQALERVKISHQILINGAETGHEIYGLTVGVGMNKDHQMVNAEGKLSEEVINASREFNIGLINSHSGGLGAPADIRTTRAVLAARLNNMLHGGSGVQESIVQMLQTMLNQNVLPVIPSKGSTGMADITILGHVGLAMMGRGDVWYQGKIVPAADAFKAENIKPVVLFGKDALSILSSNAYSSALTALLLADVEHLLKISKLNYALTLEAINGNIAPFSAEANELRPFKYFVSTSAELRDLLQGSYLWQVNDDRVLQDPLSVRDSVYYIAVLQQAFDQLNEDMNIQFNSSDDNPGILISPKANSLSPMEMKFKIQGGGAIVPTANFDPLIWVVGLERLSLTVGANSNVATQRTLRLSDEYFSHLTRFLGTKNTVHALGAMQNPLVALKGENMFLSNPIMLNTTPVEGQVEDAATNAPYVVQKVQHQVDNLYQIYGIELFHAAQAIDLRREKSGQFNMSPATSKLYNEYRKLIDVIDYDRPLTGDFAKSAEFLRTYERQ